MTKAFYNLSYFIREAKTLFKIDLLSNVLSIISIGLVFFILALVITGWTISNHVIDIVENEAEINIYFQDSLDSQGINSLMEKIAGIPGVGQALLINEEESYERMADILGEESHILALFDDNPFHAFIEVQIHIEEADSILVQLEDIEGIQYIRDNKKVINQLQNLVSLLKILGILALLAVGVSTLIVISHIIRQGIYNNREQINTLELLGAPEFFIGLPFFLEGLFLTILGGSLASLLLNFTLKYGYGQLEAALTFIPFPESGSLISSLIIIIMAMSGALGVVGSLFGLARHGGN